MPMPKKLGSRANREFTNRDDLIHIFQNKLSIKNVTSYDVIVFYGIGGIGKTSLCEQLENITTNQETTMCSRVDFGLSYMGAKINFITDLLIILRNSFKMKYNVEFLSYELAYAMYLKKIACDFTFNSKTFPFLEEGGIVADVISVLGEQSFLCLPFKFARILELGNRRFKEWYKKRGCKELELFSQLTVEQMLEYLPVFFANDLKDFIKMSSTKAVIFFDSYEAFLDSDSGYYNKCEKERWIRSLISELPDVLWIVFSREKLNWGELPDWTNVLDQHMVREFSDQYASHFLQSCGISSKDIQNKIISISTVPFYLDLSIDAYEKMHVKGADTSEWIDVKDEIRLFERFIKYLSLQEIETLKILAVTRGWDLYLFKYLIIENATGYPATAFKSLFSFSFIYEEYEGYWTMHQLIRASFLSTYDEEQLKVYHKSIFDYYQMILVNINEKSICQNDVRALVEAFYHGKNIMNAKSFYLWFESIACIFLKGGMWGVCYPLYVEMVDFLEKKLEINHVYLGDLHNRLGSILKWLGRYDIAETYYINALSIYEKSSNCNYDRICKIKSGLGELYKSKGCYEQAESFLREVIEIKNKFNFNDDIDKMNSLNCLALVLESKGKYDEAECLFRESIKMHVNKFGLIHSATGASYNNLATVYKSKSEYRKAMKFYHKALAICEKVLGFNHPDIGTITNNIAIVCQVLEQYEEAEVFYTRALNIRKEKLGLNHPYIGTIINNMAVLKVNINDYDNADNLYNQAFEISKKTLGLKHPDIGSIINNQGILCKAKGNHKEAEKLFNQALVIRRDSLGSYHPYIGATLNDLGTIARLHGEFNKAEYLYNKALGLFNHTLHSQHLYIAIVRYNLADLYEIQLLDNKAHYAFKNSLAIFELLLGRKHTLSRLCAERISSNLNLGTFTIGKNEIKKDKTINCNTLLYNSLGR